jgi:cytoskeletal protein RodZ
MILLLLEALLALLILLGIVWWTMFSGRKNGELQRELESDSKGVVHDD